MTDFEEVYNQYFKDVYKYVLSLTRDPEMAGEITQETFFKALRSIDSFRGQCRLYVWLCQIAKNTWLTHTGKPRHQSLEDTQPTGVDSLEERLADQDTAFRIHRILHTLQEPYKEVFSLRVFGELSFRQIGELFGKTESWARVTHHRARLMIKEELK
ncbi:MAG: sigma-70 family RNA polymerase sigma factor [Oscillospiraceae bacterium]|nr:sigma-70 family RNA polymerase sigma factor [Oscillospiraceae bacterium]